MSINTLNSVEKTESVLHPEYKNEIAAIVGSNLAPGPLREKLLTYHENDLAMALELLDKEARNKLYGLLDSGLLANILEYSDDPDLYLAELSFRKRVEILSKLEVPIAVAYLGKMEKAERKTLIDLLDGETRQEIILALSFDEDEIGSRMTTNYISVHTGI